ncbi:MAG TPA: DUF6544 family protein [Spirillospora sp.]|nr:DUF6544 family protein [Spirillospora sp.]
MLKYTLIALIAAAALTLLIRVGLSIKASPFPAYPEHTPELTRIPLPDNLPALVRRFYQAIAGDEIPVIDSAVLTLSGHLRFMGITFPARMRFIHEAGRNYRHYIEAMVFNFPLLKVNEAYLDGRSRLELPVGVVENEPKVDQAANLGLWGESLWLSTIFITDSRVRWETIDDASARLIVPYGDTGEEDSFTVFFNAQTGLISRMEAMRWKETTDTEKTRWILEPLGWETVHGIRVPSPAAVTWASEGTPWLVVTQDDIAYNVDVSAYVRGRGL